MPNDNQDNERAGISRREFASRVGLAAAAAVVGPTLNAAPLTGARVRGANDRVVMASIGIRGQGNALKRGFAKLNNVEIKTLCDIDANLAAERINDSKLSDVPTFRPGFEQDLRRVLDDKDVDGVIIATPNHWHALATVWALQAGKHVYVESLPPTRSPKGAGWSRLPVVQQDRPGGHDEPESARRAAGDQVPARGRHRQGVHGARPVLQAAGGDGKYPDGPMTAGEQYKLNLESETAEPTYDNAYLSKVNYDLWLGPAQARPFNRNRFHYNWHWHWDYGDGDTGNQGPHQFDIARWGLQKDEHPVTISSTGGYFGPESSQETPNVHTSLFRYADGAVLEFATRGFHTNDEGTQKIGNLFYGTDGWLWIDGDGRKWQSYRGWKEEKGPGSDAPAEQSGSDPRVLTSIESPHYQNFIDAVRAEDRNLLTCDIHEGHLSSVLPQLANIAYRTGRQLTFDGKSETFVNDKDADRLLSREYRKGFEVSGTM